MCNLTFTDLILTYLRIVDDFICDVDGVVWEVRPRLIRHGDLKRLHDAGNEKSSRWR